MTESTSGRGKWTTGAEGAERALYQDGKLVGMVDDADLATSMVRALNEVDTDGRVWRAAADVLEAIEKQSAPDYLEELGEKLKEAIHTEPRGPFWKHPPQPSELWRSLSKLVSGLVRMQGTGFGLSAEVLSAMTTASKILEGAPASDRSDEKLRAHHIETMRKEEDTIRAFDAERDRLRKTPDVQRFEEIKQYAEHAHARYNSALTSLGLLAAGKKTL